MSYALYVGKNLTAGGHAWLAGYGDEPSSHWLEIIPRTRHKKGETVRVGVTAEADLPGRQTDIPQASETCRHIRVSYSYYKGVPAPITNGGLNEYGVAVRDVWSQSRDELEAMTPKDQTGPNYSDLARLVLERATTAREGVELIGKMIADYGESSYGGNSHLIADPDEAWVMIQFAGGQGLWAAERLGANSIRASRPGYIGIVPIDAPDHPDYLYSENLVSFARDKGWYSDGPFDINKILGDGKGRWEGVRWIEAEMAKRAASDGKINLADMMWAIRTSHLTGDTAGYGQVVPLLHPTSDSLRMLWHAAIGPIAAPFAPVFMGQLSVPEEFQMHRYLTAGEAHRFMDGHRNDDGTGDTRSVATQGAECTSSAVYECKRLLYLMLHDPERYLADTTQAFEDLEARTARQVDTISKAAEVLLNQGEDDLAHSLITYFSTTELLAGLDLVKTLSASIEARIRVGGGFAREVKAKTLPQKW
ncbi:MAG: C69 family dipeptidase [Hyphomicrobiales bacterium]|nr:C69 family dipeptidase [Hyphomicrobiales bacterium]